MKNLKLTIATACLAALIASCSTNQTKTQLTYSGAVTFNSDSTQIKSLSKNGFVSYEHNGEKVMIESDNKGSVTYAFNDGDKQTQVNDNQKSLVDEAIKGVRTSEAGKK